MSERPTPETDAFITSQDYSPTGHQWRNFTRKLERERDEEREHSENEIGKLIKRLNKSIFRREEAERERDEARELLASEKITRNHIIKRSVEVEKERDEAQAERDILRSNKMSDPLLQTTFKHLICERDEARAIAYDLATIASHCLGWHDHETGDAAERIASVLRRWKDAK